MKYKAEYRFLLNKCNAKGAFLTLILIVINDFALSNFSCKHKICGNFPGLQDNMQIISTYQ